MRTVASRQKALYHDQLGTIVKILKHKVRVQLDSTTEEKDYDMKNVSFQPAKKDPAPDTQTSVQPKVGSGLGDILNLQEDD